MTGGKRGPKPGVTDDQSEFEGAFAWSGDAFFRPTVGLYVDGRLTRVTNTARQRSKSAAGSNEWLCHYAFVPKPTRPGRVVAVFCLETGNCLWSSADEETGSTKHAVSIDALLRQAQHSRPVWDTSGFVSFVGLSVGDQVALLYADVLSRDPDPGGFENACADVIAGRRTILEVRDTLILSEEFSKRVRSVDERVGHWMTWGGLRTIAGQLVGAAASAEQTDVLRMLSSDQRRSSIAFERPFQSTSEARAYLAQLALGRQAGPLEVTSWCGEHAELIDAAMQTLFSPSMPGQRAVLARADRAPVVLKGLLSSMTPGPAGRRDGTSIHTVEGRAGPVCFGPGLQTRCGSFTVRVKLAPRNTASESASGHMGLRVSYGDNVIAEQQVSRFSGSPRIVELDYAISDRLASLVSKPLLDFTLTADGQFGFEVAAVELVDRGDEVSVGIAKSPETDWSALLRIGAAGQPHLAALVASKPGVVGYLFFGPYARLFPGRYELDVSVVVKAKRFLPDYFTLEVTAGADVLAVTDVPVTLGPKTLTIAFAITTVPSFESTEDRIEFRLHVSGKSEIVVERVSTRYIESGDALRRPAAARVLFGTD